MSLGKYKLEDYRCNSCQHRQSTHTLDEINRPSKFLLVLHPVYQVLSVVLNEEVPQETLVAFPYVKVGRFGAGEFSAMLSTDVGVRQHY